jgi:hypothetical protein
MKRFKKVPLYWLYYIIDGYASASVLQEKGVLVKPALLEDELEGAFGHTIVVDNRPEIYVDLDKCMTDKEVLFTLTYEMSHAL